MKENVGKHEMDLTVGPIFKKLIIYALPLMATNILQLLFNVADVAVLAIAGDDIGKLGSTGALINLIIGLFVGLSVGSNVLVARFVGANEKEKAERVVGMSVLFALVVGVALSLVGVFGARLFLSWMNCPPEFLDDTTLYMQIYFIGMPIVLLYNFCASIMRAVGDTVRPLIYLIIAGVVNVGLNFLLTYVFNMGVAGVAIATVVSQLISVVLAMISLVRSKGFAHFGFRNMRIFKAEFSEMLKIGLPAGLQGCVFSLSNVVIMSTINSFGPVAVSGNTLATQFDGFIYNAMNAVVGLAVCGIVLLVARPIAQLINQPPDVVEYAVKYRLIVLGTTYFTCGLMEVMSFTMRGLGKSTLAMIVSLSGSCLFRILWIHTVCRWVAEPPAAYYALYWVYPVSWVLTFVIFIGLYFPTIKRVDRKIQVELAESSETDVVSDAPETDNA